MENAPAAIKTEQGWSESRKMLDEYLQVGDTVDDSMFYYFIEVLPPAYWSNRIVQIGEPCSEGPYGETFATLRKTVDGWVFAGNCYRGQTEHIA